MFNGPKLFKTAMFGLFVLLFLSSDQVFAQSCFTRQFAAALTKLLRSNSASTEVAVIDESTSIESQTRADQRVASAERRVKAAQGRDVIVANRKLSNELRAAEAEKYLTGTESAAFAAGNVATIVEADEIRRVMDISGSTTFLKLPEARRLKLMNIAFREIAKLPKGVARRLLQRGYKLSLTIGSIIDHDVYGPEWRARKFTATGMKYKKLGGIRVTNRGPAIVAVDRLNRGGSINTILHELGHSFDEATVSGGSKILSLSKSKRWLEIHAQQQWSDDYYRDSPAEAFAESFATYCASPGDRAQLAREHPAVFNFFESIIAALDAK